MLKVMVFLKHHEQTFKKFKMSLNVKVFRVVWCRGQLY